MSAPVGLSPWGNNPSHTVLTMHDTDTGERRDYLMRLTGTSLYQIVLLEETSYTEEEYETLVSLVKGGMEFDQAEVAAHLLSRGYV